MKTRFWIILPAALLLSCQHAAKNTSSVASVTTPTGANLTRAEAEARARVIDHVAYDLAIQLNPKSDDFGGTARITFDLREKLPTLALDFKQGGAVASLQFNGQTLAPKFTADGRIVLPAESQRLGANNIAIDYRLPYSSEGRGLHKFTDPEDQRVYLWTQFEPFYANEMFPCFDQPDLKAEFALRVTAPSDWQVISASREASVRAAGSGQRLWTFRKSPRISTYLFSLHAGPYQVWSSTAGKIPLRLFVRQSLKGYVHPEDWFKLTRAGLKFYQNYFDTPYPFAKYDQVIVPDFADGAMENVGAVTFSEEYVSRAKRMTSEEFFQLADTLLHEMAHMWFGDLVTMRWWNGLWLNESFASFMSALTGVETGTFKDGWSAFHAQWKSGAYWEDQLVTTHPIESDMPDTLSAFTAFDGITYGKGAAALQQLRYYVGADHFRDGVRAYFKEHAYRNTRLEDFIQAQAKASGKDLDSWARAWLTTTGVDEVAADFKCEAGRVSSFDITLTGPPSGTRPHRTEIAVYGGGGLRQLGSAALDLHAGRNPIPAWVGRPCPAFVFPNSGDHDYLKIVLDPMSLETVGRRFADIPEPITRLMLVDTLYEMVRDGRLSPHGFLDIAERALPHEDAIKVAVDWLSALSSGSKQSSVFYYFPQGSEAERRARDLAIERMETLIWSRVVSSNPGSDWQKTFFDGYVQIAHSHEAGDRLAALLAGRASVKGLELDPDRRWQMIVRLSGLGHPAAKELLAKERAADTSEMGIQMALAADAATPDAAVKKKWIDELAGNAELSQARKNAVLKSLFPPWQDDLRAKFSDRYYVDVVQLSATKDQETVSQFANYLMPAVCEPTSAERLREFLRADAGPLSPAVVKSLKIGLQEDERCVRVRGLTAAATR